MTPDAFVKLYIASKPPQFMPFYTGEFGIAGPLLQPGPRIALAKDLSGQIDPSTGNVFAVDDEIEAAGQHPWYVMCQRVRYGQLRAPSLAQILAMGGVFPVDFNYSDPTLPIKNSITPADYPPYSGPVPVVVDYVGDYAGGGRYNALPGAETKYASGDVIYRDGFYYQFQTTVIAGYNFWLFLGRNPPDAA
jgi:hypothetical protein